MRMHRLLLKLMLVMRHLTRMVTKYLPNRMCMSHPWLQLSNRANA
jgi:hypothetical protein